MMTDVDDDTGSTVAFADLGAGDGPMEDSLMAEGVDIDRPWWERLTSEGNTMSPLASFLSALSSSNSIFASLGSTSNM